MNIVSLHECTKISRCAILRMLARLADKNQVILVFRDEQPRNACADAIRISWPHTGTPKTNASRGKRGDTADRNGRG